MKLRRGDKYLLLLVLIAASVTGFMFYRQDSAPEATGYAMVRDLGTREETVYKLYEGQEDVHTFEGPEGITEVHFKDGRASVQYSDCPDQICVMVFGWIDRPGQVSVCLPNQVMVEIIEQPE